MADFIKTHLREPFNKLQTKCGLIMLPGIHTNIFWDKIDCIKCLIHIVKYTNSDYYSNKLKNLKYDEQFEQLINEN